MDFLFVQFHSTIKLFNKTENKIYQFSFIDNIKFKNVKLNLRHKDRKKLTKKDILALDIIDLL